MFKLPNLPSARAEINELADFAELLAWQKSSTSAREILAYLGRLDDNDHNIGCDDNDDENADELDEVMNEIERRQMACGNSYPFELDLDGTVLRYKTNYDNHRSDVYRYLLLSTRLNMQTQRMQNQIDGTALLEEVSASVLKSYLGPVRAKSLVFGTSADGSFEGKINHLCRELGEGGHYENIDSGYVHAKDDKLDAVAWVPFADEKPGQLVIFGQCKTGSNWEGLNTQLQPDAFLARWTSQRRFLLNPMRAFCLSEAVNRARWNSNVLYAGLVFDRCRMVDFCDDLDEDLLSRIKNWNSAASAAISIG
jgi:hypothetical protein